MKRDARPQLCRGFFFLAHSGSLHTKTMGIAAASDSIIARANAPYLSPHSTAELRVHQDAFTLQGCQVMCRSLGPIHKATVGQTCLRCPHSVLQKIPHAQPCPACASYQVTCTMSCATSGNVCVLAGARTAEAKDGCMQVLSVASVLLSQ